MNSMQGQLLVASPHLGDSNFFRTVVFVMQHDDEGAFGVVLNRPTNETLAEVWDEIGEQANVPPHPILLGGPVEGPLLFLHQRPEFSESEVIDGVFLSTQKDLIQKLFQKPKFAKSVRVFRGYSGWGPSQLDGELKAGGWLIHPATADDIFYEKDDLWENVVRKIGLKIIAPALRSDRVPDDPSVN